MTKYVRAGLGLDREEKLCYNKYNYAKGGEMCAFYQRRSDPYRTVVQLVDG